MPPAKRSGPHQYLLSSARTHCSIARHQRRRNATNKAAYGLRAFLRSSRLCYLLRLQPAIRLPFAYVTPRYACRLAHVHAAPVTYAGSGSLPQPLPPGTRDYAIPFSRAAIPGRRPCCLRAYADRHSYNAAACRQPWPALVSSAYVLMTIKDCSWTHGRPLLRRTSLMT